MVFGGEIVLQGVAHPSPIAAAKGAGIAESESFATSLSERWLPKWSAFTYSSGSRVHGLGQHLLLWETAGTTGSL